MKIRLRLILAFFLLAVVPLTGLVLYSYYSSLEAVRQSTEDEAIATAEELERRMDEVRNGLANRFERLASGTADRAASPLQADPTAEGGGDMGLKLDQLVDMLGEDAGLLTSLRVTPVAPALPPSPPLESADGAVSPQSSRLEIAALPQPAPTPEGLPEGVPQPPSPGQEGADPVHIEGRLSFDLEDFSDDPELGTLVQTLTAGAQVLQALGALDSAPSGEAEIWGTPFSYRLERVETADAETRWRAFISTDEETSGGAAAGPPGPDGQPPSTQGGATPGQEMQRSADGVRGQAPDSPSGGPSPAALAADRLFGRPIDIPLRQGDRIMARVQPEIRADALLRRVLAYIDRDQGEVPFALDEDGRLFVAEDEDRGVLEQLDLSTPESPTVQHIDDQPWVVTALEEGDGQFTFGIARPLGGPMAEIRRTASRNFLYGIGLIGLALFGIAPLSRRITGDLQTVTEGAERIAAGDLDARVEVRSADEIGQLASTFNSMAQQLSEHQARRHEEERRRRDEELQRQLLQADVDRKTRELEEAREFQLSLLPKALPRHADFELAVEIRTATEVGGDYYDYRQEGDVLTVAIGDATGHGARAGTMVTVTKSLFSTYHTATGPSAFLQEAAKIVRRMDLGRMSMALSIAELRPDRLSLAAAGMPPALLYRAAEGKVEELALPGMPLGSRLPSTYRQAEVPLQPGDTLLLTSDGVPELLASGPDGRQKDVFGYQRLRQVFSEVAGQSPAAVRDALCAAMDAWCVDCAPNDDVTLLVIQRR